MRLTRREFARMLLGAAALGLAEAPAVARVFGQTKRSILWLSSQTASGEGTWKDLKIEGRVPNRLNGTLFRTAPGQSENFGTPLNHLFDGDAYLSAWRFEDGRVTLRGRFLPTPGRVREQEAKKMLYNEYGTFAADRGSGGKNQPSVNVVEWNGRLLGLSEGGLPNIIDPETFDFQGYENFGKGLPANVSFTAHPRFDPVTGDMFAWGIERRPPGILHAWRIGRRTGKVETLASIPLNGFFMVHDAMLTENYFLIMVPPMQYDLQGMMTGRKTLGDALAFNPDLPTRLHLVPRAAKDGEKSEPVTIELPPEIAFHYGNARETKDGRIVFEMISGTAGGIFETLRRWKRDENAPDSLNNLPQKLREVTIDPAKKELVGRVDLAGAVEFPRYDMRLTGRPSRYMYATEGVYGENAAVIRVDLKTRKVIRSASGRTRTYGEPVFVPADEKKGEEQGLVLVQGYDAERNETFLDILDAATLGFNARVRAPGVHFPLGFHGNFHARQA